MAGGNKEPFISIPKSARGRGVTLIRKNSGAGEMYREHEIQQERLSGKIHPKGNATPGFNKVMRGVNKAAAAQGVVDDIHDKGYKSMYRHKVTGGYNE